VEHYSKETRSFSKSFVVGKKNDVSLKAYALAAGSSNTTFERARADVRKSRVTTVVNVRKELPTSSARSHLETYVTEIRKSMSNRPERDMKWSTVRKPMDERYRGYLKMMRDKNLEVRASCCKHKHTHRHHECTRTSSTIPPTRDAS
jgi:hypothetical protein